MRQSITGDLWSTQGRRVWLRIFSPRRRRSGSYLIYGHIHGNYGQPFWPLISSNDHMLNAGVDINGFYPVTFDELVENNRRFKGETDFLLCGLTEISL